MQIKALIFDLDGTLVNSLSDLANSVNFALTTLGLPTHPISSYKPRIGNGAILLIARSLPANKLHLAERALSIQQERYARHYDDESSLYRDIDKLIIKLCQIQIPMAILSNKPDGHTQTIVDSMFPQNTFKIIRGHLPTMPLKPDATSSLSIAEELNIAPEEMAFIGDTQVDIETAKQAGMHPVGVTWGFRTKEDLIEAGAKIIIETPLELCTALCLE